MAEFKHDRNAPRDSLWNTSHTTGTEVTGDHLVYDGTKWDSARPKHAIVVMRPGLTDPPEPVLNVAGDGWVYSVVEY